VEVIANSLSSISTFKIWAWKILLLETSRDGTGHTCYMQLVVQTGVCAIKDGFCNVLERTPFCLLRWSSSTVALVSIMNRNIHGWLPNETGSQERLQTNKSIWACTGSAAFWCCDVMRFAIGGNLWQLFLWISPMRCGVMRQCPGHLLETWKTRMKAHCCVSIALGKLTNCSLEIHFRIWAFERVPLCSDCRS
jgi:hypothetical protein